MATAKASNVLAIVFDFDDTLAPDSTSGFLDSIGLDVPAFWKAHKELLKAGWDPMPAYLHMMVEESNSRPKRQRITRESLKRWGRRAPLYAGVRGLFARMRRQVQSSDSTIKLECFLISSGIREVLSSTKIANQFTNMWACDFAYNREGAIACPKNVVSFTDKTRFLFQISKGLIGKSAKGDPFAVNRKVENLRIPMDQMVVVGDGFTDIPCFSLIQKAGGVAIGVYDRESRDRWGKAWGFIEDKRVAHVVAADYRKHSGLDDALSMAIETMTRKIKLRRITYQG